MTDRCNGVIRHLAADGSYGFIISGQERDIYFSSRSVVASAGSEPEVRAQVRFDLVRTRDGRLRAEQVEVLGPTNNAHRARVRRTIEPYSGPTLELSDTQRADALRELSRWKLEAKLEDIKRYFYTVPELEEITTGESSFVIGRKGTGKTALVEYLFEKSGQELLVTKLTFKNFPFNELYSQVNDAFTRPNQYITVWKLIIYSAVCRLIADNPGCDPLIAKSINKAFPKAESDNLGTIVEKWIAKDFGFNILGTGFNLGALAKGRSVTSIRDKVENLEQFVKKHAPSKTILILFDELDEDYKDIFATYQKSDYLDLLTSLFKAVQDVRATFRAHAASPLPVVFLRDDIYDLLQDPDKNKWRDLEVDLEWNHEGIKALLAYRLSRVLGVDEQDFEKLWYSIFTADPLTYSKGFKQITSFDYMSMSAQGRPRDYINYIQECAAMEIKRSNREISTDTIKDADKSYSNYLRKELIDEVHGVLPDIDAILLIFSELRKWIMSIDEFKKAYAERFASKVVQNPDADFVLRTLFYFSIVGNVVRVGVHIFRHQRPSAQLNFRENIVIHRGLMKSLQIL